MGRATPPTARRAKRRVTRLSNPRPIPSKDGAQRNSSRRSRGADPRTDVVDTEGTKGGGRERGESGHVMTPRAQPLSEDPSAPTLPTGIRGSADDIFEGLTLRERGEINNDLRTGVGPDPGSMAMLSKPLILHPSPEGLRRRTRGQRPHGEATFGEMEPTDRRKEPSGPDDVKMEIPPKKERAKRGGVVEGSLRRNERRIG